LPPLAGLPLEFVDLLQDLDRYQDVVVLKVEQGVGVVQEDVGIENVVLDPRFPGFRSGRSGVAPGFAGSFREALAGFCVSRIASE